MIKIFSKILDKILLQTPAWIIIIQLLFALFGFILVGAGHGTYTQFPMFYGALFLPISIGFVYNNFYHALSSYILFIPFVFLVISILIFYKIKLKLLGQKKLKVIIFIHFILAFVSILITELSGKYPLSSDIKIKFLGILIGLIFSVCFWRLFLKQVKKLNHKS